MNKEQKNKTAAIDCAEAARRFNDFMDNYLRGKARKELLQHLTDCRHCFERIEFEQSLKTKIAGLRTNISKDNERDKRQLEKIISKIFDS